ncbi:hypothetical protein ACHAW5_002396 [Stephanodiscus triporus]|uniref:Uncharacterized protein n=1 Tax=Stephanodiscus triporus TaxID=2934178 RepID=A0ABD3NRP3_9STRA
MPSFHGSRNHPQRRVFRGRGGPTDGNLPPKRTTRLRVKYQPGGDELVGQSPSRAGVNEGVVRDGDREEEDDETNSLDRDIRNLTLDNVAADDDDDDDDDDAVPHDDDKFLLEMEHLHKRIENIRLSLQTSRGLANPHTWRTNCLLPTRNIVREWRCILAFHNPYHTIFDDSDEIIVEAPPSAQSDSGGRRRNDLQSTSQQIFGLIQMSVQMGPLVGSNPGYFKRCGAEVASMAHAYLSEIAELAGVDKNAIDIDKRRDRRLTRNGSCNEGPHDVSRGQHQTGQQFEREVADCSSDVSVESCDISPSESDDSSGSEKCEYEDVIVHAQVIDDTWSESKTPMPTDLERSSSTSATSGREVIDNLQKTLLFTDKQSRKFYHWFCNAENAIEKNLPPSKSANKLLSLKSKKQTMKELKIQRKLKKKKKSGK